MNKNLYVYSGPVMEFDKLIVNKWTAKTYAVSESKARSNLVYQFKKETNRLPTSKIKLLGKIELIE